MKRLIVILLLGMLGAAPVITAQNYSLWITTEGAGLHLSNESRHYGPPPPPRCRYDRHYDRKHRKHKKHDKKLRKRYKEYRKAQDKYYKELRKPYWED